MSSTQHLTLPAHPAPPVRDVPTAASAHPHASKTHTHPTIPFNASSSSQSSLYFVGTATTILSYAPFTLLTDPNFLHAGDHVHLGPGVTGTRVTNPAISLSELPSVDVVLLSHYHADHFDEQVEARLRRDLPIVTTEHAKESLVDKKEEGKFEKVVGLKTWEECVVRKEGEEGLSKRAIKIRAMPGKHVADGVMGTLNDWVGAVPPTHGHMVELGKVEDNNEFKCGYRIYISGDTLLVDDLKEIPRQYAGQNIDLMLVHLGGTTIPSPSLPLLMVTMDAEQGLGLLRLINPELTIPIHYDDYDVFLSPLADFKKVIEDAGLTDKVVYLDRGEQYDFEVK